MEVRELSVLGATPEGWWPGAVGVLMTRRRAGWGFDPVYPSRPGPALVPDTARALLDMMAAPDEEPDDWHKERAGFA